MHGVDGPQGIDKLMFHTVVTSDDQECICFPREVDGETILVIDTCSREDISVANPVAPDGKVVSIPHPDSD